MIRTRLACFAIAATLPVLAHAADSAAPPEDMGVKVEPGPTAPSPQDAIPPALTVMYSKWSAQLYGFVEADAINDSTQTYNDIAGGTVIPAPGSYAADHGRLQFGVRNSRIGFKLAAPDFRKVKASAVIEGDFEGNQNTIGNPTPSVSNTPADNTEAAYYNNPAFRIRHAYVKLENPYIDFLAGQSWELFGWQGIFQPASVEIQGVPGEVYSRTVQVRLSHTFDTKKLITDVAVAALRPVQRDSDVPDIQAGIKFSLHGWKGWHTMGSAGSQLDRIQLGISGLYRHFNVTDFTASCTTTCAAKQISSQTTNGWGVSVDALVPVILATAGNHANALTLIGSWVDGSGIADQYTGLTGGMGFPTLSVPTGMTAPTYSPDIDSGFVTYGTNGKLTAIEWTSFIVGAQYYLPFETVWVAANFAQLSSPNDASLVATAGLAKIVSKYQWIDGNVFWDVTPQVRLGVEYARFNQTYGTGVNTFNNRVQFSAFYIL